MESIKSLQFIKTLPPISCILAIDEENGIGKNNSVPWKVSEDMQYFQNTTTPYCSYEATNVVIMGHNTWKSIPIKYRPLVDRINIIISKSCISTSLDELINLTTTEPHGAISEIYVKSVDDALNVVTILTTMVNIDDIFICGGQFLYNMVFDHPWMITGNLHITHIKGKYDTDVRVNFNNYFWELTHTQLLKDSVDSLIHTICIYKPKTNNEEFEYLNMLNSIITTGNFRQTRNANTWSRFATNLTFDLNKSFPLLTTKKMFLRGIFEELKFFLLGQTNTKILEQKKVNIWKGNTTRQFLDSVGLQHLCEGDMGPLYGFQLRHYGAEYHGCNFDYTGLGYDQFANVLNLLKTDKYSRRIMMTTYNPAQIAQGPLPPCHGIVIHFGVEGTNKLSCHMYQR